MVPVVEKWQSLVSGILIDRERPRKFIGQTAKSLREDEVNGFIFDSVHDKTL